MERGEVYWTSLDLPDRRPIPFVPFRRVRPKKYVVILRGGPSAEYEMDVPFVIASTDKRPDLPPRPFEVVCPPGGPFDVQTKIDCRFVYTLPKAEILSEGRLTGQLSRNVMEAVNEALVDGLQMF